MHLDSKIVNFAVVVFCLPSLYFVLKQLPTYNSSRLSCVAISELVGEHKKIPIGVESSCVLVVVKIINVKVPTSYVPYTKSPPAPNATGDGGNGKHRCVMGEVTTTDTWRRSGFGGDESFNHAGERSARVGIKMWRQ